MNRSHSQKYRWDNEAVRDYQLKLAREEGIAQAKKQVAATIAKRMKEGGVSFEQISRITKLTIEEIEKL